MVKKTSEREINELPSASNEQKKQKKSIVNDIFDIIELIAISFGVILLISAFFFRHSVVSGGSMLQTLKDKEHLILSDFLYEPQFSDIVVFQLTEDQTASFPHISPKEPLIKRVIATEGQKVKIIDGVVYVNGNELVENYIYRNGTDTLMNMDEITVSENHVFVMGDHRNDSLDSRYFGEIDTRLIIGKVVLRIYPFENFGKVK